MDMQWCTIIIIVSWTTIKSLKGLMNLIIEVITLPYQHGHNIIMQKYLQNSEIVLKLMLTLHITHTPNFNNDPSIHH